MSRDNDRVTICRRVSFSSGHRYFNPDLTDEENRELYGLSYSSSGHGHNYVLEAHLEGAIDARTGMVINLKVVDTYLKETVAPLDHHFLNEDVPYFRNVVPTTENLAIYCFNRLKESVEKEGVHLQRIRLYEGDDFWVDCGEPGAGHA